MESEDKKAIFTKRTILIILAVILLILVIFLLLRRCGNGSGNYKVNQITLTPTRINVRVGEQQQIYANVLPSDAKDSSVYWTIEDPSIADVDQNGVITGKKDGVTIVTATANDGSGVSGTYTLYIETIPVTGITIKGSATNVTAGNKVNLSATVAPSFWACLTLEFINTVHLEPKSTGFCENVPSFAKSSIDIESDFAKVSRNEPQPEEQASLSIILSITPFLICRHFISWPPISSIKSTSGSKYLAAL